MEWSSLGVMLAPACTRSAADEAALRRSRAEFWKGEAGRLAAENVTLAGKVEGQRQQVEALRQRVVTLSRMLFGTSSEKDRAGKRDEGTGGDGGGADRGRRGSRGRRRGQRPGSAGHGRRRHEHLDTEEQLHDLPEDQRRCPRCGRPYGLLGEDVSEQVSWRVKVVRVVHRRRKYARGCRCPVPAVLTAPAPPGLIARGLFTTEFCVNLLIAKYALGLPFNRVIAMLAMQGLDIAPGTLAGVARRLNGLLEPLAAAIAVRNAAAGHAHADETSWRVFGQPADNGGGRLGLWRSRDRHSAWGSRRAFARALRAPGKTPLGRRNVSLSLGDERVVGDEPAGAASAARRPAQGKRCAACRSRAERPRSSRGDAQGSGRLHLQAF